MEAWLLAAWPECSMEPLTQLRLRPTMPVQVCVSLSVWRGPERALPVQLPDQRFTSDRVAGRINHVQSFPANLAAEE